MLSCAFMGFWYVLAIGQNYLVVLLTRPNLFLVLDLTFLMFYSGCADTPHQLLHGPVTNSTHSLNPTFTLRM